ncbi:hypothetical protein ACFW1A_39935 [Kitasatospora sp. NPDC058965]|uniref:hypothetical protein n=1 Tax=Kitasatospora sp. NPDC058965 TaxID=3346682 RepID=UPI00368001F6
MAALIDVFKLFLLGGMGAFGTAAATKLNDPWSIVVAVLTAAILIVTVFAWLFPMH